MNHSLEINLFLCLLTSERGPFRALKMRPVRQVLLLARHDSENASGAAGGGFHAPGAPENASRTPVPFFVAECLFRTVVYFPDLG